MNTLPFWFFLLGLYASSVTGFWGKSSLVNGICKNTATAMKVSKNFCSSKPELVKTVVNGIALAIRECQHNFRHRRWNCSTVKKSIRKILQHDYRETAFVFAITSAGIAYEVSKACSTGSLEACKCLESRIDGIESYSDENGLITRRSAESQNDAMKEARKKHFQRNGCKDFVKYGIQIAKQFVERGNNNIDAKALVTRHNCKAGREAVKNSLNEKCKCHGLSQFCTMKTCWSVLDPFDKTSSGIKKRFDRAIKVYVNNNGNNLIPEEKTIKPPTSEDLVYTTKSPEFCYRQKETGSLGTVGRRCNVTSMGIGGCELLCCSRGYTTKKIIEHFNCKCQFFWCCEVTCKRCKRERLVHTCL